MVKMIQRRLLILFIFVVISKIPSNSASNDDGALILSENSISDGDGEDGTTTISSVANDDQSDSGLAENVFVPTDEWQAVKPGQAIPRGLHVRLNLATGENEAKLIESQKPTTNAEFWESEDGKKGMVKTDGSKTFTRKELKEALKKFDNEAEIQDEDESPNEESIKKKFRSYDELKKDLADLRVQVKSDLEILNEILVELKQPNVADERKLIMLEDLEYLVHQIDTAQNFADMGGFSIVLQLLNCTDARFREWAAFVVGSATQSNPKVQIAAMESGIMHQLIRVFQSEQSPSVRRKYLFAFSAMLRHFPFAQKKFMELGGLQILADALRSETTDEKVKIKTVTLLADLLQERTEIHDRIATYSSPSPIQHEKELLTKRRQYEEAPLVDALLTNDDDWCSLIGRLLSTTSELDNQEKVIRAMHVMFEHCHKRFDSIVEPRLVELRTLYTSQVTGGEDESDNEYLVDLLGLVSDTLSKFERARMMKDEL